MRMRSLTKVHRVSDEVEEFDSDGSIVAYRKTLLEARARASRSQTLRTPQLYASVAGVCCAMLSTLPL